MSFERHFERHISHSRSVLRQCAATVYRHLGRLFLSGKQNHKKTSKTISAASSVLIYRHHSLVVHDSRPCGPEFLEATAGDAKPYLYERKHADHLLAPLYIYLSYH